MTTLLVVTDPDAEELSYSDNRLFLHPLDSWYNKDGDYVIIYDMGDELSINDGDEAEELLNHAPEVIRYSWEGM